MLIVECENLMSNTYAELKRMLDFIGYPYSEDDILCTVKSTGEGFHRKHTKKHYNPFSPKLQEFVLNKIKEIDASLLKHNISLYYPYTIITYIYKLYQYHCTHMVTISSCTGVIYKLLS